MSEGHEHCIAQPFEKSEFRVLDQLRFHVFVCTDGKGFCGCEAAGSGALLVALRQEIARRRLVARCKITIMQCRQPGAAGPLLVVHPDGIWYDGLTPAEVPAFVESQLLRGEPLPNRLLRTPPQAAAETPLHVPGAG